MRKKVHNVIKNKLVGRAGEKLTGCDSGVMALAITAPGEFGDLLARLQTEERDLGSIRSA